MSCWNDIFQSNIIMVKVGQLLHWIVNQHFCFFMFYVNSFFSETAPSHQQSLTELRGSTDLVKFALNTALQKLKEVERHCFFHTIFIVCNTWMCFTPYIIKTIVTTPCFSRRTRLNNWQNNSNLCTLLICMFILDTLYHSTTHVVFEIWKVPYMAMSRITQQHYTIFSLP